MVRYLMQLTRDLTCGGVIVPEVDSTCMSEVCHTLRVSLAMGWAVGQEGSDVGVRYIGSKARIAEAITAIVGSLDAGGRFVDGFCGTGSVAKFAARRGWPVVVNDSLRSAVVMSSAGLTRHPDAQFASVGGYGRAIELLNDVPGMPGFIHREYSPASAAHVGHERRYFTEANAARIDGMRSTIAAWRGNGRLSDAEETLLLGDLLEAANSVANISGTYGCYLAKWTSQALRPVELTARELLPAGAPFESRVGDVFDLETRPEDVVYYDPPYTKRQYAAYYHLLETITARDSPVVGGVTGLRPWQDLASDFCYKRRALGAIIRLVSGTTARRVLLSYSSEGHVDQGDLMTSISHLGQVKVHEIERIGRYRPNAAASAAGSDVLEYLLEVTVAAALDRRGSTGQLVGT